MTKIGVIGAGAWGTALAQAFASAQRETLIWAREPEVIEAINTNHENTPFLPDIPLAHNLQATNSLDEITKQDILLLVTPAQYLRPMLENIKNKITPETILVICSKGIEIGTGLLMSEVVEQTLPDAPFAILTGPTFASEIARGLPGAVTIAANSHEVGLTLQKALGTPTFRPYINDDIIGTQLGGAIKNVIAIACGIIHGKKLGESARAALMTRGIAEMARLAETMGAKKETLLGMCGIGDLMLTAASMQSRNFSLGAALGEGIPLEEILKTRKAVTEGIHTAKALASLAATHNVDMPITKAINDCLNNGHPIDKIIDDMLDRPFKQEI